MNIRYEFQMWFSHFVKYIPGYLGAAIRNGVLPYKNGKEVIILDGVQIDKPSLLVIGNRVSINRGCIINAGGGIIIGDDVLIGPNVIIYSQNHAYADRSTPTNKQGYILKKTVIGDNVWIAASCIILPGVVIGDGAIIAAGSVVTKNVESNTLSAGNPARVIKTM